jgi:hypothetical protein
LKFSNQMASSLALGRSGNSEILFSSVTLSPYSDSDALLGRTVKLCLGFSLRSLLSSGDGKKIPQLFGFLEWLGLVQAFQQGLRGSLKDVTDAQ